MELKSAKEKEEKDKIESSNRTFMELKLTIIVYTKPPKSVLIVPLWN